jgi:aspartate racemase
MGIVGIVGGLGPESTVDYYRRIIQVWREQRAGYPHMVIDSLDPDRALDLVANDRRGFLDYISQSVATLSRSGVDFITIAANTPHLVFDELAAGSPVPMMSIVEVCAAEAERRGFKKLALLGTRFTMEAPFYPDAFGARGMSVVSPDADDRSWLHARYVGELLIGDFREETRENLIALIERLRDEHHVDALILGGTELPLLLRADTIAGLPALDTTELHVRAIVERLSR